MAQIAEEEDGRIGTGDMCTGRYDQRRDDHFFDVTKYFLRGLFDVLA